MSVPAPRRRPRGFLDRPLPLAGLLILVGGGLVGGALAAGSWLTEDFRPRPGRIAFGRVENWPEIRDGLPALKGAPPAPLPARVVTAAAPAPRPPSPYVMPDTTAGTLPTPVDAALAARTAPASGNFRPVLPTEPVPAAVPSRPSETAPGLRRSNGETAAALPAGLIRTAQTPAAAAEPAQPPDRTVAEASPVNELRVATAPALAPAKAVEAPVAKAEPPKPPDGPAAEARTAGMRPPSPDQRSAEVGDGAAKATAPKASTLKAPAPNASTPKILTSRTSEANASPAKPVPARVEKAVERKPAARTAEAPAEPRRRSVAARPANPPDEQAAAQPVATPAPEPEGGLLSSARRRIREAVDAVGDAVKGLPSAF